MTLSENDFNQIIAIVTKCSGIIPLDDRKEEIKSYIENRLTELHDIEPIVKFKFLLEQDKEELAKLISALIYHENYFFKDEKHFTILKREIFPNWQKNNPNSNLRIWSAACSTGEEAYSLALLAHDYEITPTITASDISNSSLNICSMGNYSVDSKRYDDGAMYHYLLIPYLAESKKFIMPGEIRSLIHTKQINLATLKNHKLPSQQHIIFLRNVLIYFKKELQREILKIIAEDCLADDGYLFLSQKEAALIEKEIIPPCLEKLTFDGTSYFHKNKFYS